MFQMMVLLIKHDITGFIVKKKIQGEKIVNGPVMIK